MSYTQLTESVIRNYAFEIQFTENCYLRSDLTRRS